MSSEPQHGLPIVLISFALAFTLTALPLPEVLNAYRPPWCALVLIYWLMALPYRIGIKTAWAIGLVLDVLKGILLGQHALALSVVAFITLHLHLRIRVYPFWQQSIIIGLILFSYQVILFWTYNISSTVQWGWVYWISPIVGALLWPGCFILLRSVRRRYQVR